MDQNQPMPATPAPATPSADGAVAKSNEHWMVEVAGGVTLGSTVMAALALWATLVAQIFYS